jgi:hypothetical protein
MLDEPVNVVKTSPSLPVGIGLVSCIGGDIASPLNGSVGPPGILCVALFVSPCKSSFVCAASFLLFPPKSDIVSLRPTSAGPEFPSLSTHACHNHAESIERRNQKGNFNWCLCCRLQPQFVPLQHQNC